MFVYDNKEKLFLHRHQVNQNQVSVELLVTELKVLVVLVAYEGHKAVVEEGV
jgi:hypothetical protein